MDLRPDVPARLIPSDAIALLFYRRTNTPEKVTTIMKALKKLRAVYLLSLLLPSVVAAAAPGEFSFAYEDVGCDGTFTPGVDRDLTDEIGLPGYPPRNLSIFVENCLSIPAGTISPKPWASIFIMALGWIRGAGTLTTKMTDEGSYAFVKGDNGMAWFSGGISSGGDMYIGSENGGMYLGPNTRWTSGVGYVDFVAYDPAGVSVDRGVVCRAATRCLFYSEGEVVIEPGLNVQVTGESGQFIVSGLLGLHVEGAYSKAEQTIIETPTTPLVYRASRIRTAFPLNGHVDIATFGPCDVTGTQVLDVEPQITCDPIVGN